MKKIISDIMGGLICFSLALGGLFCNMSTQNSSQRPSRAMAAATRRSPSLTGGEGAKTSASGQKSLMKGLGAVVIRNEFYRDGYRILQSIAIMQSMIICALVLAMFYVVHVNQKESVYFATTEDGRLIPMVPMGEPNLSTPALTSWAAQAATEVMTFGFSDYRRRLQEASRNFTRVGWQSFTTALDKARTIQAVESQRQNVTAVPEGAPIVVEEGMVLGRYQWRLQMPMVINYESSSGNRSDKMLIELLVVRVPRLESPSGIGIEQWVAHGRP